MRHPSNTRRCLRAAGGGGGGGDGSGTAATIAIAGAGDGVMETRARRAAAINTCIGGRAFCGAIAEASAASAATRTVSSVTCGRGA
jgi:hypothetical protein